MAKASSRKPAADVKPGPAVRIIARREGWRRCGVAHSIEPKIHEAGSFTEDEVRALLADPQLIVDVAPEGYAPQEPPSDPASL